MKKLTTEQIKKSLTAFHNDEEGAGALEVVMLLAIAALVVAVIIMFGKNIAQWAHSAWDQVVNAGGGSSGGNPFEQGGSR